MKNSIFIFFLLLSFLSHSQKVVLYTPRRIAYTHMENYITFYSKEASCSSLVFKTDNGSLRQHKCMFVFVPARKGRTMIKLYKSEGRRLKLWDSVEVMVYDNQIGEAQVAGKTDGSISKDRLIEYGGITVYIKTRDDHLDPISVASYSIVVHKVDSSTVSNRNSRNIFEKNSIELLKTLQTGDKITFANIKVVFEESRAIIVRPIEFTIQ